MVYVKKTTQNEVDSLQEVVVSGFNRTYNTFGKTEPLILKHSISYDSFF
ncbi:hypothetical protein [Spiroplasma endosymbiont of Notiophilus biguttatus]